MPTIRQADLDARELADALGAIPRQQTSSSHHLASKPALIAALP